MYNMAEKLLANYTALLLMRDLNCIDWHFNRVVLRCRQLARERFAKLRSDVLVKLELLDNKHGMLEFLR